MIIPICLQVTTLPVVITGELRQYGVAHICLRRLLLAASLSFEGEMVSDITDEPIRSGQRAVQMGSHYTTVSKALKNVEENWYIKTLLWPSKTNLKISRHHLCHTMATQMLNADADLSIIQGLLGITLSGQLNGTAGYLTSKYRGIITKLWRWSCKERLVTWTILDERMKLWNLKQGITHQYQ